MKNIISILVFSLAFLTSSIAQENTNQNQFKQLGQELPTPNVYRAASGAPGHEYWQQKADYKIKMHLDEPARKMYGKETITYHNNSPDVLTYLWLQLDQNVRAKDSDTHMVSTNEIGEGMSINQMARLQGSFEGGFNIDYVKDANGKDMKYIINKTMMRVDLATGLAKGQSVSFSIKWWYNINDHESFVGGRSGYEYFAADDNDVYVIAQFFPRMCVYNEVDGWQNKQFMGRGEFTLVFGDYEVEITVPEDHLVAASGELQNPDKVLTKDQRNLLSKASKEFVHPVTIASLEEASERVKTKLTKEKTWIFKADNVRDFAFASSRRFIWDVMGVKMSDGRTVMAQSMWIKEGNCLWSRYSTKAIAHTIKWYSHYTFDYPYPVAWSIDGSMGMEYPMIAFNNGRCETDGTYTQRAKYGHIGVIIHEVGHNWFPMIVNSDERQWTWMDEGLNTFVQFLTEQQWERNYPSRRGPADKIVSYMKGDKSRISPIMTNSESIFQFGANAYAKPATALNILRETVMGRELFDYAFKEYANRWKFKHPSPADFFRTMEDASAVDLDWFWRGWFFTNEHVNQAVTKVRHFNVNSLDPNLENEVAKNSRDNAPKNISLMRNEDIEQTYADMDSTILDFYSTYDPLDVSILDEEEFQRYKNSMSDEELRTIEENKNYYELTFENKGGLVMPVIFQFEYTDGTTEDFRIPAEIWRFGQKSVSKIFPTEKEVSRIILDPYLETADVDRSDNYFPPEDQKSRFELFRNRRFNTGENPMQRDARAKQRSKYIKP